MCYVTYTSEVTNILNWGQETLFGQDMSPRYAFVAELQLVWAQLAVMECAFGIGTTLLTEGQTPGAEQVFWSKYF